ncbi:DUF551 domain-containing protein [Klebsiella pneumoniae]|uniref:DUF551 domain-containing protein n=1 Tax=Klebsiella TaxID=570 RepID=UPI00095224CB|nr:MULTISPECIES: DUF551 domain-containing protein [Klebsiella]AUN61092.1 DUF551 domain-containing protein [Klebsiella pneumoniae]AUY64519.1 hypothetical protein BKY56_006865 [Klebsiella pneumoniae]MDW1360417.1 DUF551 domain-containing protein [Klebsiella pneumoniae]MDW1391001.1 DUF551 domain-containing protein [Klebsiella pneumoniae]MDX6146361.1 DUF551 domain-containing protein [Klebsiella sp. KB_Kp057]
MTSKLTREERVQSLYGLMIGQVLNPSDIESIKMLARMALAAMDGEPVAEVLSNRPGNDTSTIDRALPVGTQLYRHAQPAPVVPDEINSASAPEVFEIAAEAERLGLRGTYASYAVGWNACRAAMLAAAPQSPGGEPATVPGKWIPVSERMPETDGNYWGWWSESKRQGPVWFIKSELQAQFQSSEITHWMPLPAAPQEVKGE